MHNEQSEKYGNGKIVGQIYKKLHQRASSAKSTGVMEIAQ
jgi:hypothetical protein